MSNDKLQINSNVQNFNDQNVGGVSLIYNILQIKNLRYVPRECLINEGNPKS
jgi:hypothetical protein